jgi:hypothetical protein
MADPNRPPEQRSLFDFGVRRVAEKQKPPTGCGEGEVVVVNP